MKKIIPIFLLLLVTLFNPYILKASADTFSSNCIINKIGNAPGNPPGCNQTSPTNPPTQGGNTPLSKTALALYADGSPCGDINKSNYQQCFIKNITTHATSYPNPQAAIANINYWVNNIDVSAYQCINFVETAVAGTYGGPWYENNQLFWPDAIDVEGHSPYVQGNTSINWSWVPIAGATAVEGDIPVWAHNHIAIITAMIDPQRQVAQIDEANYDENGDVNQRNVSLPNLNPVDGINNDIDGWEHQQ